MSTMTLACRCGEVKGVLRGVPDVVASRVVCHCTDCQTFARHVGHEEVLDRHGGTDIVQLSPANLAFEQGAERLACLRLTDGGPFRWYASCCGTPIANTPPPQAPFVGLLVANLDGGEESTDEALGLVRYRMMAREALAPPVEGAAVHAGFPAMLILRLAFRILWWRLRGDARRTPFFDPETGAPLAVSHTAG